MTNAFNKRFDAMAHKAFMRVGTADKGTYTGPESGAVAISDVRITIDRDVEMYGDATQNVVHRNVITIWNEDVQSVESATVKIGSETFTLEARIEQDEGTTSWVVM